MQNLAVLLASEGGSFNPLDFSGGGGMLWTWIIFGASLPFIWKVVMGPVTRALLERDLKAAAAIASAEESRKEAQAARDEVEAALAQARSEAARTVEAARERAEARGKELTEEAMKASEMLLQRARVEIRAEQDKAVAQIRAQVVDLSLAAASKVLERRVDSQDDRRLVESLVGSVKTSETGGRP